MIQACEKQSDRESDSNISHEVDTTNTSDVTKVPSITKVPDVVPTLIEEEVSYIQWKDQGLEALIREVIHKAEGRIRSVDVESIQDLCIVDYTLLHDEFSEVRWSEYYFDIPKGAKRFAIKDWSDLSYLKNLKCLVLCDNDIEDISFLHELTNITFLNISSNYIVDYKPLSNLTSLQQLYIRDNYSTWELGFLRKLPLEKSDIDWEQVYYPLPFSKEDCIEGITMGNLLNTGFVANDGRRLYTMKTDWGDLAHGCFIQYDRVTETFQELPNVISEQMAQVWDSYPGAYINERVNSLNYDKDYIYYISMGTNNDTADAIEEGYYYGDPLVGIIKMNVNTQEREVLTTELFSFICVARDHIYGVNNKKEFVRMSLDGKDQTIVVKESCVFAYVDEDVIYYLTDGKKKKLMKLQGENDIPQLIIEGDIVKAIVQEDFVFYVDSSDFLYCYNMITKEKVRLFQFPIKSFNLDNNNIFMLAEEKGVCRSNLDGSNLIILREASYWDYGIQIVADYLFIGGQSELWKMKKDGTEYNVFYKQW